jgi:GNAT superfamily N-acetyltransferase
MFEVKEENTKQVMYEALELARAHYYEVEAKSDKVPFNLDVNLLNYYMEAGILYIVTARDQEKLVGYFANMISPDPITSQPIGKELGIYVDPAYRNSSVFSQMCAEVEEGAKKRYAYSQLLAFKEGHDHGIAEKLGYEPTETIYQKVFEV